MGRVKEEKARLRQELLAQRAAVWEREQKDRKIFEAVSASVLYRRAGRILFYISSPQETDTHALLEAALKAGKEVFAPVSLPEGRMVFYRLLRREDLRPGRFGILEPPPLPEWELRPEQGQSAADTLCFVPGVAFDRFGYRIGYGKGYYDRFLSETSVTAVGLCYRELALPRLPSEGHDRPVAYLFTEQGGAACAVSKGPDQ